MKGQNNTSRKTKTRAELRAELAHDLALVLNNPELPKEVYEGITDDLKEFYSMLSGEGQRYINDSEDYIKLVLEGGSKGGAR
ncbi:MAG TPA: hypothetical protein VF717_09295 [Pyrinomonadaceae bacterium]|jgi:hypothetical protein